MNEQKNERKQSVEREAENVAQKGEKFTKKVVKRIE